MAKGPLSNEFLQATQAGMQDILGICDRMMTRTAPALQDMLRVWRGSLAHEDYTQMWLDEMTAVTRNLGDRLCVGHVADMIDDAHWSIRFVTPCSRHMDDIAEAVDTLNRIHDRIGEIVSVYGTEEQKATHRDIMSRSESLRIFTKCLASQAKALDDSTDDLRCWLETTLAEDADGVYGPYGNSGADMLRMNYNVNLLEVRLTAIRVDTATHEMQTVIYELRGLYASLSRQSVLEICSMIGDKDGPRPPQP